MSNDETVPNWKLPAIFGIVVIVVTFLGLGGWAAVAPLDSAVVAQGNIVMTERVDHFRVGEKRIMVPCMGIFELRDGKIAAWRDYWDLRQFECQLPAAAP